MQEQGLGLSWEFSGKVHGVIKMSCLHPFLMGWETSGNPTSYGSPKSTEARLGSCRDDFWKYISQASHLRSPLRVTTFRYWTTQVHKRNLKGPVSVRLPSQDLCGLHYCVCTSTRDSFDIPQVWGIRVLDSTMLMLTTGIHSGLICSPPLGGVKIKSG